MSNPTDPRTIVDRATLVEGSFRVLPGLYALGMLERGVTVYKQQVRAHNLSWALYRLDHEYGCTLNKFAIVGGGIAGLTAAACCLALFPNASITVYEQLWDLCPLQQGADSRWLHPRIYDWPIAGSRAPEAGLPVLNWSEGRASDVARRVLNEFGRFAAAFDPTNTRLSVYLGMRYLRINAGKKEIAWMANRAIRDRQYFRKNSPKGGRDEFDSIILASGFGLERQSVDYLTPSYWRNEQVGQPILDGTQRSFLVSGFGDGALIDLCRLTIERYRQDTILEELFQSDLENVENHLAAHPKDNLFPYFAGEGQLQAAIDRLGARIRKDTRVVLHISGSKGDVTSFEHIFGPFSSFLNRLLTFLLFRCGAFYVSFDDIKTACRQHQIAPENVLCRHGGDALNNLLSIFSDPNAVKPRLLELKQTQPQETKPLWELGVFPVPT